MNLFKYFILLNIIFFTYFANAACDDVPANEVDWTDCNFVDQTDLSGVSLAGANMAGVNLSIVNLEKSLIFGERISGHFVQGHVDTTCKVSKINFIGRSWLINFKLLKKYRNYIVPKGSITINGVSLTISKLLKNEFQISIIPHTLRLTNLVHLKKNDIVNVEFDVLGKYIKNFI